MTAIIYRATVRTASTVSVTLDVLPSSDGEDGISRDGDDLYVYVPEAASGGDVGAIVRAFGALIAVHGAVRITIEPDPDGAPKGEP